MTALWAIKVGRTKKKLGRRTLNAHNDVAREHETQGIETSHVHGGT